MTLDLIAGSRAEIETGSAEGELTLTCSDVRFHNLSPGRLSVEVTFQNNGPGATQPTTALIGSAPLGAFVSWRPLTTARVPALPAGGRFTFRKDIGYTPPVALGTPDRVPSGRLLTAISAPDPQGPRANVATDLLQLVGQGSVHWA